jgi:SAM-dependent methyltransferase
MNFKSYSGKEFELVEGLRSKVKPDWEEMLKPAKPRNLSSDLGVFQPFISRAEDILSKHGINLIDKDILEVGCSYGQRCFLMAKYRGNKVHGIDIDEYIVDQSPDLNSWNPGDVKFIHDKTEEIRKEIRSKLPECVHNNVTFETVGMEEYATPNPHDIIVSWDTLEHILNLPLAFRQMYNAVKSGGIVYHEYNPFFSLNGGHSLCTLDFLYGHCRLSKEDFERYIHEIRPIEEKIDLNFYHKCLNRATVSEVKELSTNTGFEIIDFIGQSPYGKDDDLYKKQLEKEILGDVQAVYPKVTIEDLMYSSVFLILRKQ